MYTIATTGRGTVRGGRRSHPAATRTRPHRDGRRLAADLRAAHLQLASAAAGLDLDDAREWVATDGIVARAATEAYRVAAALTGRPPDVAATRLARVARLRELATAQRALFALLDTTIPAGPGGARVRAVLGQSTAQVRVLARLLRDLPPAIRR